MDDAIGATAGGAVSRDRIGSGARVAQEYLATHAVDDDDGLTKALVDAMMAADEAQEPPGPQVGLNVMVRPEEMRAVELLCARLAAGAAQESSEPPSHALDDDRMRRIVRSGPLLKVGTEAIFKREHTREVFVLNDCIVVAARVDGSAHSAKAAGWWPGSGAGASSDVAAPGSPASSPGEDDTSPLLSLIHI